MSGMTTVLVNALAISAGFYCTLPSSAIDSLLVLTIWVNCCRFKCSIELLGFIGENQALVMDFVSVFVGHLSRRRAYVWLLGSVYREDIHK